jgi:PREDICTED: similar to CG9536-PA
MEVRESTTNENDLIKTDPIANGIDSNFISGYWSSETESWSFSRLLERNVNYLQGQLRQLFDGRGKHSHSLFVATLCLTIIAIYIINLLTTSTGVDINNQTLTEETVIVKSPIVEMFTLTPGNILSSRFWIWSAVSTISYPLIEMHWWQVVNDVIAIYLSTTLIEPLWGSRELISFFVIINLTVAFLTTTHYVILFSLYGDDKYLYNVRIYGLSGYCAAICVSFKQLLSESVLLSTSLGKFKNSNVPLSALFLSILLYVINMIEGSLVLMFFYGLLISWFYLRFIQSHNNGSRGDYSEGFSFASFFPNVIKPFVSIVCNTIYQFFVTLHICSPANSRYQSVRVLSERLSQEHSHQGPIRGHYFKHHQSGDYQYLHQPMHV